MAIDMIDTAIGGMQTRFARGGKNPTLLILASSKRSEKSFLESHMREQVTIKGYSAFIVDEPIWNVWPPEKFSGETFKVALGNKFLPSEIIPEGEDELFYIKKGYRILNVPTDLYVRFASDIDRALCDYAGISSSELQKYISGARVNEAIAENYQNPFIQEKLEIGNAPDDKQQYYDYFDLKKVPYRLKSKPLYIHLDMSISGDCTGIAGTWIVGKQPMQDSESKAYELRYQLAFAVSIQAPKGHQISFAKNRDFIYWLRHQGFNIQGISSDSYQNATLAQDFIASGFNYKMLSVDRVDNKTKVCEPYLFLKNAIYDRRVLLFEQKRLIQELTDLERNGNTGKVDHPENGTVGCFTPDTKVRLVDGRSLNFLELEKEYNEGKENWVYSFNETEKKIEPKRIIKAWCTLKDQKLVKITLDNGEEIKCTLNHKFMLRDGTYVEAQDLVPYDSLMPLKENHKVVSVEFINETSDVYDITVEDNHNFALDCGVFVHNSKDAADAFCGSLWHASLHADEYSYNYSEDDLDVLKSVRIGGTGSYDDINKEFEQELKDMFVNKTKEQIEQERKEKLDKEEEDKARMLIGVRNGELVW